MECLHSNCEKEWVGGQCCALLLLLLLFTEIHETEGRPLATAACGLKSPEKKSEHSTGLQHRMQWCPGLQPAVIGGPHLGLSKLQLSAERL